ncbi:unnamed protein product, partial [marine sediment metagenome]
PQVLALEQISAALRIKLGYVYLVLPISGLLIMFYALVFIVGRIKGKEIQEPVLEAVNKEGI